MHISFTTPVISALDGIIKETVHRVTIVLVILGRIDASLRGNGMRSTRRILETKCLNVVAHFSQ